MPYDLRLADYRQTIKVLEPNPQYEQRTYPRLAPILIEKSQEVRVLTQSGYAVGFDCKIKAQAPLFPDSLMGPAEVVVDQIDDLQWKTSWSYVMAIADDQAIDYATWQGYPETVEVL